MEKAEKIDFSNRPKDTMNESGGMPHCPFWFFGNEESADKDLKDNFEIVVITHTAQQSVSYRNVTAING